MDLNNLNLLFILEEFFKDLKDFLFIFLIQSIVILLIANFFLEIPFAQSLNWLSDGDLYYP